MSRRSGGRQRKEKAERKMRILDAGQKPPLSGKVLERARSIGMLMDPSKPTTPMEIDVLTSEMVKYRLLEKVVVVERNRSMEIFGPTKEFLDMFLPFRKQLMEAGEGSEAIPTTCVALGKVLNACLEEIKPEADEATRLADSMNYYFLMAMYMAQPQIAGRLGIDPWEFFPTIFKEKAMSRAGGKKQ